MRRTWIETRVPWHVVLKGARRLQIFHERQDYEVFLAFMRKACSENQVDAGAYALLSNHGHLALMGDSSRLSSCMKRLDRAYSGYHNRKYGLSGHTFEDNYFAKPVLTDFGLQRVARYIHLNPVRAGLCERPEDYAWSDYRALASDDPCRWAPAQHEILALFAKEPSDRLPAYAAFLKAGLRQPRKSPPTANTAMEVWQEQFIWILERAESCRTQLGAISPRRAAVFAAVRAGIPPRAIGRALGKRDGLSASQAAYRIKRYLENHPDLEPALTALSTL